MAQNLLSDFSNGNKERLGVGHLVGLTTTIAISLAAIQLIRRLRMPADSWYFGMTETSIAAGDAILAIVYGTGIGLTIFAVKTRDLWNSLGKIIAIILGAACVIHWGLDFVTACVMAIRFNFPQTGPENYLPGTDDGRAYLFGTMYRNVSIYYGYFLFIPFLLYVLTKTWRNRSVWTFVWMALLAFVIASIGRLYFNWHWMFPNYLRGYYFIITATIPLLAALIAFFFDLAFHRERLDWWTVSAIGVFTIGIIGMVATSLVN